MYKKGKEPSIPKNKSSTGIGMFYGPIEFIFEICISKCKKNNTNF